jgi:hypothetical protein
MRNKFVLRIPDQCVVFGVRFDAKSQTCLIGGPRKFQNEMAEFTSLLGGVWEGGSDRRVRYTVACTEEQFKATLQALEGQFVITPVESFGRIMN